MHDKLSKSGDNHTESLRVSFNEPLFVKVLYKGRGGG